MRVYVVRRLLQIVPTVLMITFVVFLMMQSIPGDPVVALLGDAYTEEDAVRIRESYGLDQPVVVQYFIWLGKLVRGDWGASILTGRPVLQDVLVRLPVTLELIVLSMGIALLIAIPAAIIGALRQNTWADGAPSVAAALGSCRSIAIITGNIVITASGSMAWIMPMRTPARRCRISSGEPTRPESSRTRFRMPDWSSVTIQAKVFTR